MGELLAFSSEIERAFKSLIKSGRPDITEDDNDGKSLIPQLYVDLFDNDYILKQVLDDNHTLLKGRRGTGKSTIFLRAEHEIHKRHSQLAIYINLQTCYDEIKSANSENENDMLTKFLTYKHFMTEILNSVERKLRTWFAKDKKALEDLFTAIEKGHYIDKDFQRSIELTSNTVKDQKNQFAVGISKNNPSLQMNMSESNSTGTNAKTELHEIRVFSIHDILKRLTTILNKNGITRVYLFLDDFSELNFESQQVVVDSLIAPIVSSYNETFKVKLAGYPGRVYTGNIDTTKLPTYSLDFYDAFEQSSSNYNEVEDLAVKYVERTLSKRLEVFTNDQIRLEHIFDTDTASLQEYLQQLFHCTAGIPRSLGFILTYCYLSSINNNRRISMSNIEQASVKYFEENILADFVNDARFKQSFHDDKELLDQLAHKNLMDKIVDKLFGIKRDLIDSYQRRILRKQIFLTTIENYRRGNMIWLPTSHFYVEKTTESLLKTLELYFIVNKFHEGSSREPGKKISIYGLNFGLCLIHKIDYGRPSFRRTYDYWRQEEFNLDQFIPEIISSIEVIKCSACNKEYSDVEYSIYQTYRRCFQCTKENTVTKVNRLETKLRKKLDEWHEHSLPNLHIEILRTLYNNRTTALSMHEIGTQVDKHHLAVLHALNSLQSDNYVSYEVRDKRYYKIKSYAIQRFFSDSVDKVVVD